MNVPVHEAQNLHAQLLAACRDKGRADARCAELLARMEEGRLYRQLGFARLADYAEQALQLSARKARDLLRLARELVDLPVMRRAFAEGRLPWTKARELLRVVTAETESEWTERAVDTTSRDLEHQVNHTVMGEPPPADNHTALEPARRRMVFTVEASDAKHIEEMLALLRAQTGLKEEEFDRGRALGLLAQRFLADAADGDELPPNKERYMKVVYQCATCGAVHGEGCEVSDTEVALADCDALVVDMMPGPSQGRASRTIPPAVRRAVMARDERRCVVPGCSCTLWVEVHHEESWASGGPNTPDNLSCLCGMHHGLTHDGLMALRRDERGAPVVEFADGRVLRGRPPRVPTHVGQTTCREAKTKSPSLCPS